MNENLKNRINGVVGIYVLSCLAASIYCGWQAIIVGAIGFLVITAILQTFRGGTGGP